MVDRPAPDYANVKVVEALPLGVHYPRRAEDVFRRFAGATIVRVGTPEAQGIEGGGLVIDYCALRSSEVERVVFAFTEEGMWIEWAGSTPA